ncbi:DNA-directed RNA polymerase subunit beta' [Subdoligranulum sp. APC924/74]|uniref:DNA-directed RNA polymerase subunit beta' n=3 Tax=Eubacteriales TaxID=186802 RepID=UPI000DEBCAEB|nr:DNA-directed RNA polymerase subunit beta' [Subdoligranulum sp. APC924/74]RCH52855.1 DNA-directed RNA polymerase subunit beta' [Subdoligranulum sp. APC924/74]
MENKEFDSIKIGLASPDQIRAWSYGEVKKPETINYRTLKPERDGLFCERIFGPTKDWECHCGKYKRIRYKGKICDKCGVEVTRAKVRRERMGHIELAAPVSHIWYFKGIPSRIGLMLDIGPRQLDKVLYFANYIVTDPGFTPLEKKQLLTEREYKEMREKYEDTFEAGMGAEAVQKLLAEIDLEALSAELHEELEKATGQKRVRLLKRLECVDAFRLSGQRPEWMILNVVPVIPPDIRPMVQLDGGRFATSDLNDLYRRVINRNNRLKRLLELGAPDIIVRNEKRMLQEAVDALIDNGRRGRPVTGPNNRALKSLSDMLKGKQGRFRQNLLGKRVDYSGRSVIVVGPELKMYQCGLPKEMALELFKPFVMKDLVQKGIASNIKAARKKVERASTEVWDSLETVIEGHPVLLNRAPTLHRLGIQAFEPVLVEGHAIKLHPLVCTPFNADFDGDQMAVHLPLSTEAQREAKMLMLASGNLLKPSDGEPVTVPTQDMILGSYYLTMVNPEDPGHDKVFRDEDEALMAYAEHIVTLQAPVKVRRTMDFGNGPETALVTTTVGKIIFNTPIPQDLGYVDRTDPEHKFDYEVDFQVTKKKLPDIISRCLTKHGTKRCAIMLDHIKAQGYKYSTLSAITVAVPDAIIPEEKPEILAAADKKVEKVMKNFNRGLISDEERYKNTVEIWQAATEEVSNALSTNLKTHHQRNPIYMMSDSGARGSMDQIKQLAGMRGLLANTAGKTLEMPIRANYREGLNILEYFISSRGARKGLTDTALRTADSGYLTRRLVDVSQEVIIREEDCHATEGILVSEISEGNATIESFSERLIGRYALHDVMDPKTGELIVSKDKMMDMFDAEKIKAAGITELEIRSVMTCRAHVGVCARCYGSNMSNGQCVKVGESVGIIAAQSIGEPGTQLTMRTFHTGGIASAEDITQGLPRVEELFESRRPKAMAIMSEIAGTVHIDDTKKSRHVEVTGVDDNGAPVTKSYLIPFGHRLKVMEGDVLVKGALLTEGHAYPQDILAVKGRIATQNYLISEVQKVYRLQGVEINDKHIEVIVRQMMRKVRIDDAGSSEFIMGSVVNRRDVMIENEKIQERIDAGETDLKLVQASQILLGITKSSLATDSFLSAASFQETTRVLTEAAIKGKVDPLAGLKENVIIGKLIPAGTGLPEVEEELARAEEIRDAEGSAYDHAEK